MSAPTPAAAAAPAQDPYRALYGDTWRSPWWIVPNLSSWTVRAQVRETAAAAPLFSWVLAGGDFDNAPGVVPGTAHLRLTNNDEIEVPALRLRLDPDDWDGIPNHRRATLEVEFTRGDLADPTARFTKLRRRFEIAPDLIS